MSWRDTITLASWNGIEFDYLRLSGPVGQRVKVAELPFRGDPVTQDLGRRARRGTINGMVSGDNYLQTVAALKKEWEKGGVATFVHPTEGKKKVKLTAPVDPVITTGEGGMARFTIQYVEVPSDVFGGLGGDTLGPLLANANAARSALNDAVKAGMTVAGFPDFVRGAVDDLLSGPRGAIDALRTAYGKAQALIGIIDEIAYEVESFLKVIDDLLGLPGELASAWQNLMRKVAQLIPSESSSSRTRGASISLRAVALARAQLSTMMEVSGPTPDKSTPSRRRQAANQLAIEALVRGSAAIEIVEALAEVELDSRAQAVQVREMLVEALTQVAEEGGDDGVYLALKRLAASATAHFDAVSATLPQTSTFTPTGDTPALVLAHYLYGDAAREQDIVDRNQVAHPGFIPAGEPLEVLHV